MSRTDTALKPLVENSSSAAMRIASRKFGLRAVASGVEGLRTIFVPSYKRSGHVNENRGRCCGTAGSHRRDASAQERTRKNEKGVRMWSLSQSFGNLVLTFALVLGGASARAETFPNKPVHILVPYAAGGAVDVLARTIGQALAKSWGQQPVIDNRPGAGGIIASQALTQAPPDGYTLILVASGHPLNQFIYPSVPYDTFKDFTAISEVASSPLAIVVAKDSPYKSLGDLLTAAKKEPDKLSYGMSGNGTSAHLAGELLKYMAGVKIVAIPYKGGAPALTAVIAGEIPLSINPLAEAIGQLEGGGPVRALAVTSA